MKFNRITALIAAYALVAGSLLSASALNRPAAYTDIFLVNKTTNTITVDTNYEGKIDANDLPYAFQRLGNTIASGQRQHILRVARGGYPLYPDVNYKFNTNVKGLPNTGLKFIQTVQTTNIHGPAKTSTSCITIQIPVPSTITLPALVKGMKPITTKLPYTDSPCYREDQASAQVVQGGKWAVGNNIYTASFQWTGVNDSLYQNIDYIVESAGVVTPATQFTILQYNIQQRPSNEGMNFQVTGQHNERTYLSSVVLPQAIKKYNADVVTVNEGFTARLRPELIANMERAGYKYHTDAVGANSPKAWSGGAMVFSKYPIVKKSEYLYQNAAAADQNAAKGVWYVQINKNGKFYNVFATHTNASYSTFVNGRLPDNDEGKGARLQQFKELRAFIDRQNIPVNQPVIIIGDMNVDKLSEQGKPKDEYAYMLATLNASQPTLAGHKYTYDAATNQLVEPRNDPQQWLDYALYSNRHQRPLKSSNTAINLKAPQGTMWGSTNLSGKDLSDHYPLLATFEFPGNPAAG